MTHALFSKNVKKKQNILDLAIPEKKFRGQWKKICYHYAKFMTVHTHFFDNNDKISMRVSESALR